MPILHKHQRTTYTIVDNQALRDTSLSWRATGMLAYLLSLPDDWNVNIEDLTRRKSDGRTAARSTMQELKDAGYVRLEETRDDLGQFHRVIHVHETCQTVTDQNTDENSLFTDGGLPDFGPPDFGEPDTKKDLEGTTDKELPKDNLRAIEVVKPESDRSRIKRGLVAAMGWNVEDVTTNQWGKVEAATTQLVEVDPTVSIEEIVRRGKVYQINHPDWAYTPTAVASHWADCAEPRIKPSARDVRDAVRQQEMAEAMRGLE